ncbi:pentapeptide repeat-containing protein [Sphaerisporangium sp. NPDC051017]|uniref:pentapeptide repeat-containing protein n=1 Tax=unclassified Sphaerisporangium TaxID=2630420 RepID=UPI0033ECEBFB
MSVRSAVSSATPRELADLPYASYLEPLRGDLEQEGDYNTVHADGTVFEDAEAGNAGFTESVFSSVTFTGGRMQRARFHDVWLHTVRWVGTDLAETSWLDAEVVSGALAGVAAFSAELRRVRFFDCKFDSVNWRTATLQEVQFVGCLLRGVDFGGARLTDVTFPGSTLEGVRLSKAQLKKVDLRGAAALGIAEGIEALKGATIDHGQLLDLAPLFAQALGVIVKDR